MTNKLKELEIKKLIKEYDYLLVEDEYKDEFIDKYKPEFLKKINDKRVELGIDPKDEKPITEEQKEIEKKEDKIEVNRETRRKIKDLYRKIVKITHPDKTNSEKLLNHYINAKKYYEQNNLLEIYLICINLNIDVDLGDFNIDDLIKSIEKKKIELENIKKSYLWMWVNSETEEGKDDIVKLFISKNG